MILLMIPFVFKPGNSLYQVLMILMLMLIRYNTVRMKLRLILYVIGGLFSLGLFFDIALSQSSSNNYQIEESYIGPGGQLDSSSASYEARASLGDTGIGYSSSTNFGLWAGYTTTDVPFIEMVVTPATIDLGVLDVASASYTQAVFYVRTYLASGYVVSTVSDPPTSSGNFLAPMTAGGTSSPGTEQFGINLVANTSPATYGANPQQFPDGSFGFGFVATGYDTTNNFRYNKGDIIARSNSSSGRTDYTISYLYNISDLTIAGLYTLNHTIVATSTY